MIVLVSAADQMLLNQRTLVVPHPDHVHGGTKTAAMWLSILPDKPSRLL